MQLAGATSARWRMELLDTDDGVTVLNDAYNANPTSMRAALSALAHLDVAPGARRIAVLGDMRELGRHHDDAHHEIGAWAAELGIDVVVGVGAGGRMIVDATSAGGAAVHAVANAGDAVHIVSSMVRPGDAVLVKGSRALALEQVADDLLARGRQLGAQGGAA